jgi:hypothetical protein
MTTTVDTTTPDVTRTCQNPAGEPFTTAGLLATLEQTWATIRTRHPEVPAAVLVVASGSPAKATGHLKWGHFATLRWQHGSDRLPEVLVSGEGLSRTPAEILTTLLHEAAHGLADTRHIQDTSRQGRWHNKHFAKHALELGLTPSKDATIGWSPCTLRPETAEVYTEQLDAIGAVLGFWRHAEVLATKTRTSNNNGVSAECDCARKIRVSLAVYEAGPILCGLCEARFHADDTDPDPDGGEPA